jgi:hypothetical protein
VTTIRKGGLRGKRKSANQSDGWRDAETEFHCDSPSSYLNKADHRCGLFIKGDFSLGQIWRSDERRKYLVPSA